VRFVLDDAVTRDIPCHDACARRFRVEPNLYEVVVFALQQDYDLYVRTQQFRIARGSAG
jgi:hypothetical protein